MAKGVPKNFSPEERERRRAAMQRINQEKRFVAGTVKTVDPAAAPEGAPRPAGPSRKVVAAGRPRMMAPLPQGRRFTTSTIRS
jgi:hypothetical protein